MELSEQPIEISSFRNIALDSYDVSADPLDGAAELFLTTASDENSSPLRGELPGGCQSDAAVGAGDQDDLPFKAAIHNDLRFCPRCANNSFPRFSRKINEARAAAEFQIGPLRCQ